MAVCTPEQVSKRLNELIEDYYNHPPTMKIVGKDGAAFKKLYRATTGQDFDFGEMPSTKDLGRLDRRLKTFQSRLLKGAPGKIAQLFYLPDEFLKGNPDAAKTFDAFVINHNHYRGSKDTYGQDVVKMADNMRKIAKRMDVIQDVKLPLVNNFNKAQKEIQLRYDDYKKIKYNEEIGEPSPFRDSKKEVYVGSEDYWNKNLKDLGKNTQFKVFEYADRVLRNPELIKQTEYAAFKPVLETWVEIRPKLFKDMKQALGKYVNTLKNSSNADQYVPIIKNLEKLNENLLPTKNYFPTQLLNIFPTMKTIQDSMYNNKNIKSESFKQIDEYVNAMVDNVINQVGVTNHAKEKSTSNDKRYNKNIIGVLDAYVNDVTKFNYMVNTTDSLLKGIKNLRGQSEGEISGSTKVYMDYLFDTHATMMGYNMKSPQLSSFARGITSWQFISKLGFNLRTAARNSTQSLQNLVYFGFSGWNGANKYLKESKLSDVVKKEMERHGVYFDEVRELADMKGIFPDTETSKINGQEILVWKTDSTKERFLNGLDKVAQVSSKPMRYIENNLNRKVTFKIAFAQAHEQINSNRGDIKRLIEDARKTDKGAFTDTEFGKTINEKIDRHVANKSSRFAANMVKLLHYEYSAYGKPQIMQKPIGAIAGQFMTYSFNFFNYQKNIVQTGGRDLLAGDWKSPDAHRLGRLGMMYFFINGVLSTAFNTEFGNLVQNDTVDRARQFVDVFSSDDEKRQRAFFGKGPIIGTIGGPFISDMVTLGNVAGFYDMLGDWDKGDRGALSYLAGYQDYSDSRKNQKLFDVTRTINSELGRLLFVTGPRAYDGAGFATLAGMELGLYSSKELKDKKGKAIKVAQKLPVIGKSIPTPKFAKKKSKRKQQPKQKDRVLMALGALGRSGTNSVGSSQWLENIINNQKFTGESLQPLKGNMSKYNNKLMASAKRKGYVGDFAQGSWT
tara:strand:- start:1330 stop:4191 length:2862 start_codon:yes stop_codon:yes gene_type:complete